MSDFKGRRFPTELILLCVRCYCKFGVSYRDLARPLRTPTRIKKIGRLIRPATFPQFFLEKQARA